MLEYVLIFFILIYIIDYLIHNTKEAKLFNQIPGPKTLPVLGNILDFIRSPIKLFYLGRHNSDKYKSIYRIWGGFRNRIVSIHNPEDAEVILSSQKHITKSYLYEFLHPWLKDGLLTSGGEKWQKHRKILTPTFHFNILQEFCVVFEKNCKRLVRELKKTDGAEIDILPFINRFALHTISETAMGTDLETIKDEEMRKYKESISEMGLNVVHRLVRAWLYPNFLFRLSSLGRKQKKTLSVLHNFSMDVIQKRRNERKTTSIENTNDNKDDLKFSKKRMAMLDLLLSAEEDGSIDEEGIREEVDTFMFEGHDTTTMAITFCLMELANNKDIQDKAYEEIKEILRDPSEPITIEKLNQMKYLERCIKESLRLYPSVVMIGRIIHEEVKLPNYTLPAGTTCHIHIFDMHRKAHIFPDPFKFNPDRFLLENCTKRHPFAYIPFSAGPRNCIGQKFALLEEKAAISNILLNFQLEPITRPENIIFTSDLVLKSVNPIKIKFVSRS